VPSVKVLMGIVGLYLAPFCYHSSFFFFGEEVSRLLFLYGLSMLTPFVFLIFMKQREGCLHWSLQLQDMHNFFCRMSYSSSIGGCVLRTCTIVSVE